MTPADPTPRPEIGSLLKSRHQDTRWLGPLRAGIIGLALTLAVVVWTHFKGVHAAWWWTLGSLLTGAAVLVLFRRGRRSVKQIAQHIDRDLHSKNRLEAAAQLLESETELARAQREETSRYLEQAGAGKPPRRKLPFWVGLFCLLLALHFNTALFWLVPWPNWMDTDTPAEKPPVASIQWKAPESETKALKIEEVPLNAEASSTSGLRNLTLHVSVNGKAKPPLSVPLEALGKPGNVPITTSLFMDELEVEPFDIVSYYLDAHRISKKELPLVASPVQFIQIRPFRDDARQAQGGDGESGMPLVLALKSAQLRALKENFLLAHTDLPKNDPVRQKENTRVGEEQGLLATKTDEAITKLTAMGTAAEIIHLLEQARELMPPASGQILKSENEKAIPSQTRSLSFITEVEKYMTKVMAQGKGKAKENVADPFKDAQQFELKKREETAAGELEKLAAEQARLAKDLSPASDTGSSPETGKEPPDKNKFQGTPPERQTQISQGIASLLNAQQLPDEVAGHLKTAQAQAKDSLKQLDADDPAAAREPASAAALELAQALAAMNRLGEQQARDTLAQAQRQLNDAAQKAREAGKTPGGSGSAQAGKAQQQAAAATQDLQKQAERQQQQGSAKAAAALNDLAKTIAASKVAEELQALANQPGDPTKAAEAAAKLESLASLAALKGRNNGAPGPEEVAQLLSNLERGKANMERLAQLEKKGEAPGTSDNPNATGPGTAPKPTPGESPGKPDSSESPPSSGPGQGKEGGPGSPSQPSPPEPSTAAGNGTGTNGHGIHADGPRQQERQQMAEEVMQQLKADMQRAEAMFGEVPDAQELIVHLSSALHEEDTLSPFAHVAADYQRIQAPLDNLITWLATQAAKTRRQHLLAKPDPAQAPASYREAVADYYEQLSQDYDKPVRKDEEKAP